LVISFLFQILKFFSIFLLNVLFLSFISNIPLIEQYKNSGARRIEETAADKSCWGGRSDWLWHMNDPSSDHCEHSREQMLLAPAGSSAWAICRATSIWDLLLHSPHVTTLRSGSIIIFNNHIFKHNWSKSWNVNLLVFYQTYQNIYAFLCLHAGDCGFLGSVLGDASIKK
jgi:hypothetical protein